MSVFRANILKLHENYAVFVKNRMRIMHFRHKQHNS